MDFREVCGDLLGPVIELSLVKKEAFRMEMRRFFSESSFILNRRGAKVPLKMDALINWFDSRFYNKKIAWKFASRFSSANILNSNYYSLIPIISSSVGTSNKIWKGRDFSPFSPLSISNWCFHSFIITNWVYYLFWIRTSVQSQTTPNVPFRWNNIILTVYCSFLIESTFLYTTRAFGFVIVIIFRWYFTQRLFSINHLINYERWVN